MSNRRFFVIAAVLLLGMSAGSWFIGHAGARGVVQTIDVGEPFDAQAHRQALPANQRVWINATYSASKVDNATVDFVLNEGQLNVRSVLTIDKQGKAYTWGGFTTSGNSINYSYGNAFVQYTFWDSYFKEDIILTEPVRTISWQMTFDARASVETDGDDYIVKFTDKEITPFFIRIPKPIVTDANGVTRQLRYSYVPGTGILTLVQDFGGLTFPLAIDPVYTVDAGASTGYYANMLINASGIPQITYGDGANFLLKLAQNVSGTWTKTTIGGAYTLNRRFPWGSYIDPTTDLPIVISKGVSDTAYNFSWWASGKWRKNEVRSYSSAGSEQYGIAPIGISSSSGRVLFPIYNGTNGDLNITIIDSITGTSITATNATVVHALTDTGYEFSGEKNASEVLNFIWFITSANPSINWTTVTDSSTPTVNTISVPSIVVNASVATPVGGMKINPTTGFPGFAYKPYKSTGADADRYGRQVNYTYYNNNKWYFEIAATNSTSMSSIIGANIGFNSSGTPYIIYVEKTGTEPGGNLLNLIYRISANSWSTPVTIDDHLRYYLPTIAFDSSDNLHIAYYDSGATNLMYYFEPLSTEAGGSAPVASFILDKSAIIRNMTVTLTDQSSNIPTSWDFYSPGGNPCFTGNDTRQNPVIFPKWGGKCVVCEIATNAFGTDTSCEGSIWVARPQVTW